MIFESTVTNFDLNTTSYFNTERILRIIFLTCLEEFSKTFLNFVEISYFKWFVGKSEKENSDLSRFNKIQKYSTALKILCADSKLPFSSTPKVSKNFYHIFVLIIIYIIYIIIIYFFYT